jgi:polyisoprenyl-phosphate glycosyltransferase
MSCTGFVTAIAGFVYAIFIIVNAIRGQPVEGWSSLMVAVMVIGGFQMLMLGVLGEYIWRALDEARRRPRYTIEAATETNRVAIPADAPLKTPPLRQPG